MNSLFSLLGALLAIGMLGLLLGSVMPKLKHVSQSLAAMWHRPGARLMLLVMAIGLAVTALASALRASGVTLLAIPTPRLSAGLSIQAEAFTLPVVLLYLVVGLTGLFVLLFALRALAIKKQLTRVIGALSLARAGSAAGTPEQIGSSFSWHVLKGPWQNYSATLVATTASPKPDTVWRAAIPSGFFFSRDALIDDWLMDSFGRHLPGILTGLGIVGTFAGMLEALSQFDPSTAESAALGLKGLLSGVSHAFVASMGAISCAIFVTALSRMVIAHVQKNAEKMTAELDRLYPAGAGESQMSDLYANLNASHLAGRPDEALTQQLLQRLVEQMTQSHHQSSQALADLERKQQFFEERLLHCIENAFASLATLPNSVLRNTAQSASQPAWLGEGVDRGGSPVPKALSAIGRPSKLSAARTSSADSHNTGYRTLEDLSAMDETTETSDTQSMQGMDDFDDSHLQADFEQRIVFSINRKLDRGFARIESKLDNELRRTLTPEAIPEAMAEG
jgi:hypothetical protein